MKTVVWGAALAIGALAALLVGASMLAASQTERRVQRALVLQTAREAEPV